ncbi:NADH-quinone oxidoreductase subunit G [Striga asiatica]|uniref:NADH-quinone oxidoreductase subunit G n=1 Tax=Striga asiatica TaxID=4170 RepID=A0A5A7Q5M6_STRAF|nr:NADH-quinone oxidoreductase subunit G [Striga asiatica]
MVVQMAGFGSGMGDGLSCNVSKSPNESGANNLCLHRMRGQTILVQPFRNINVPRNENYGGGTVLRSHIRKTPIRAPERCAMWFTFCRAKPPLKLPFKLADAWAASITCYI